MKRIQEIALFLMAVLLVACNNSNQFTVDGKLQNAKDLKKVVLYRQDKAIDSAVLNENQEFRFKVASADPDFYYIVANDKNYLFVASNGDELTFTADYTDKLNEYNIEGSDVAEKLKEFNKISNRYGKIYLDIQNEYQEKLSRNPALKDSLEQVLIPRFEKNMKEFSDISVKFANENKDNLAGFYAIGSLDPVKYEAELIRYADDIKGKFPNNKPVADFVARMEKAKGISVGQKAPDFESSSVTGAPVKLSDFKGKYVLLDFWASWCGPCRQENPNIVKQYQAFKNKNFTILSVSLDDTRDKWLKAIKDDKLDWNHVSDLNQWNSKVAKQYQVESIPASFLLDPQGKILAKNLRGSELEDFLKGILK